VDLAGFTPKYITFDCYGALTPFQMTTAVLPLIADRVAPEYRSSDADPIIDAAGSWGPHPDAPAALGKLLARRGPDTYAHDVRTTLGTIRADQVVIATSGYTGGLTPWLRRRIVPVGSYIVVTGAGAFYTFLDLVR
jgi:hypothetical protein